MTLGSMESANDKLARKPPIMGMTREVAVAEALAALGPFLDALMQTVSDLNPETPSGRDVADREKHWNDMLYAHHVLCEKLRAFE